MIAFLASLLLAAGPCGLVPKTASGPTMLSRAVFAEGRLWLRSEDGAVYSLAEREPAPRLESMPGPALDLCVHDGALTALTCTAGAKWSLTRHAKDGWMPAETIAPARGEQSGYADSIAPGPRRSRIASEAGQG